MSHIYCTVVTSYTVQNSAADLEPHPPFWRIRIRVPTIGTAPDPATVHQQELDYKNIFCPIPQNALWMHPAEKVKHRLSNTGYTTIRGSDHVTVTLT